MNERDLPKPDRSTERLQQGLGIGVVVIAAAVLLFAKNWDQWFGPEAMSYRQAQSLFKAKDWDGAVAAYDELASQRRDWSERFWFEYAFVVHASGDYDRAIPLHRIASESSNFNTVARYNLACALSMLHRVEEALLELEALEQEGTLSGYRKHMMSDPDLDPLRGVQRFDALMERLSLPSEGEKREYPEKSA